jgi:hypothetical protein
MARVYWTYKGSGNWTTGSDWNTGSAPGASDDAFVGIQGITVTSDSNVTVNSIGTNLHSRLVIGGTSTFTATDGTGPTENLGTIQVEDAGTFQVGAGTFYNYGHIDLTAIGGRYSLFQVDNVVQLEGGGAIEMRTNSNVNGQNAIMGNFSQLSQIDNVDNDIRGQGIIHDIYFDNQANGILETNSIYGAGTLILEDTGGPGTGFENEGHVSADDGGTLELIGSQSNPDFFNSGTFSMNSVGDRTVLEIAGYVTLDGGGKLTLSDDFYNYVETDGLGYPATFENVDNFISGSGQIYDSNLTLINDAQGTVEADNANAPLVIDTGSNQVINIGTFASVNGASLQIMSAFNNVGTFEVNDASAYVVGEFNGYGRTEIFSNSKLELIGTMNYATATFENNAGDNGLLMLDHATGGNFKGTVAGMLSDGTSSDTLGLQDINFASRVSWSFTEGSKGKGGSLTVSDGNGDIARVTLLGQYLAAGTSANSATSMLFQVAADTIDHTSGTLVTTSFH